MAKPPAFQFYVSDYVMGTMLLEPEERGAYVDCLCHQWLTGGVPADDTRALAKVMRVSERDARRIWARIADKFTRCEDGLWWNERMEIERHKQRSYKGDKAAAGRLGGLARAKQKASKPPSEPLANGWPSSSSSSSSSSSIEQEPPIPPSGEGGLKFTRDELKDAKGDLDAYRASQPRYVAPSQREPGREYPEPRLCPHEPQCDEQAVCLALFAKARRERVALRLVGAAS